jgi:hypothetical protein
MIYLFSFILHCHKSTSQGIPVEYQPSLVTVPTRTRQPPRQKITMLGIRGHRNRVIAAMPHAVQPPVALPRVNCHRSMGR